MTSNTHQTAPTRFVEAKSIRFAYRSSEGSATAASRHRTDNAASANQVSRRDALLELVQTDETEGAPVERLHIVVAELCRALSSALRDDREAAQECLRRAAEMLQVLGAPSSATEELELPRPGGTLRVRGGLAPWQICRLTGHIEANLNITLRTRDLAALVQLSPYHFCRAFRDSWGESPQGYVMRRRMERAQGLMLSTDASLAQIAADCGLADQAHFSRLFRRFAGESPGAWRHARAIRPAHGRSAGQST